MDNFPLQPFTEIFMIFKFAKFLSLVRTAKLFLNKHSTHIKRVNYLKIK